MKKILESLRFGSKTLLVVSFSIATIFAYLAVTFVLGWELLGGVRGTDTLSYLSKLKFLAFYFPKYPFWDPIQGAGLTTYYSYPILTQTLIITVSKIARINIIEALKLVAFFSVPLTGFGIFTYVWVRFRIAIIAFLAGLFYILSPIAWVFLFEWGFFAEAISGIFFPPTILFFDLYLIRSLRNIKGLASRLLFIFCAIFLGLSLLAHPTVFFGELTFVFILLVLYAFFAKERRLQKLVKGVWSFILVVGAAVLLSSFWTIPFYRYQMAVGASSAGGAVSGQGFF